MSCFFEEDRHIYHLSPLKVLARLRHLITISHQHRHAVPLSHPHPVPLHPHLRVTELLSLTPHIDDQCLPHLANPRLTPTRQLHLHRKPHSHRPQQVHLKPAPRPNPHAQHPRHRLLQHLHRANHHQRLRALRNRDTNKRRACYRGGAGDEQFGYEAGGLAV